jgi:cysteine desulfurase
MCHGVDELLFGVQNIFDFCIFMAHYVTMNKRIYLDYAAATPTHIEVEKAMQSYWGKVYGNSNALHFEGREARKGVEEARIFITEAIGASSQELIFTSGGTESNSMAIRGVIEAQLAQEEIGDMELVTSVIEHPSVKDIFTYYEKKGARVIYLPVDAQGIVVPAEAEKLITDKVRLVSLMFANNEIGTVQPVAEVARLVKKKNPNAYIHTDASQAPLFFKLSVTELGVDLLTLDAQKIYGPKGIGALFIKKGTLLEPLFIGGKQERGLRPGTPNVPGIVGFHKAYEIAEAERQVSAVSVKEVRDYFLNILEKAFTQSVLNGDREKRLPNNINISFPGVESEFLVLQLDAHGVACSAKSACLGAGGEGSPVVAAMHTGTERGALRFSLGKETTKDEVNSVVAILKQLLL